MYLFFCSGPLKSSYQTFCGAHSILHPCGGTHNEQETQVQRAAKPGTAQWLFSHRDLETSCCLSRNHSGTASTVSDAQGAARLVHHAGPAAGALVTVTSPVTEAQKQLSQHCPWPHEASAEPQCLTAAHLHGAWALRPTRLSWRQTSHRAVPQVRSTEEQHRLEGSSGSSTSGTSRDLPRARAGPCLHV